MDLPGCFQALSLLVACGSGVSHSLQGYVDRFGQKGLIYERLGLETSYPSLNLLLLAKHWQTLHHISGLDVGFGGHSET